MMVLTQISVVLLLNCARLSVFLTIIFIIVMYYKFILVVVLCYIFIYE